MNLRRSPDMFLAPALRRVTPRREGFITRDLSMPPRDWSRYDASPAARNTTHARRVAAEVGVHA